MAKIAEAAGMELRIFPRDKNTDIMNLYLNQGKHMSIPVFVFLDKDMGYLCHWIERPAAANKFMAELNAELAQKNLPQEERMREMRRRMTPLWESWRQETAKELRDLWQRPSRSNSHSFGPPAKDGPRTPGAVFLFKSLRP